MAVLLLLLWVITAESGTILKLHRQHQASHTCPPIQVKKKWVDWVTVSLPPKAPKTGLCPVMRLTS